MKRTFTLLALFVALMASTVSAQYSNTNTRYGDNSNTNNNRDRVISRTDDPQVYTDNGGEYHWQTVEKQVWIPEYQTQGVFGVGRRTIPGHYEMRSDRIKIYHNGRNSQNGQYNQNGQYEKQKGWEGKHPHGIPPGQRKKQNQQGNGNYDPNYPNGNGQYDNGQYGNGTNTKSKKQKKQKGSERDDD